MPVSCLRFVPFSALFVIAVVTTGCDSTAVTPTMPEPPSVTQVFAGTVSFQLAASENSGIYRVRGWDAGILPSAVTFSVNITRPQQ